MEVMSPLALPEPLSEPLRRSVNGADDDIYPREQVLQVDVPVGAGSHLVRTGAKRVECKVGLILAVIVAVLWYVDQVAAALVADGGHCARTAGSSDDHRRPCHIMSDVLARKTCMASRAGSSSKG